MFAILGILLLLWLVCIIIGALIKAVGWLLILGIAGLVATALFGALQGLANNRSSD